jgi:hypothetical protein
MTRVKRPSLGEIGAAAYGSRWKTAISRDLGWCYRTVLRHAAAETPLDEPSFKSVLAALRKRRDLLDKMIQRAEAAIAKR